MCGEKKKKRKFFFMETLWENWDFHVTGTYECEKAQHQWGRHESGSLTDLDRKQPTVNRAPLPFKDSCPKQVKEY